MSWVSQRRLKGGDRAKKDVVKSIDFLERVGILPKNFKKSLKTLMSLQFRQKMINFKQRPSF